MLPGQLLLGQFLAVEIDDLARADDVELQDLEIRTRETLDIRTRQIGSSGWLGSTSSGVKGQ